MYKIEFAKTDTILIGVPVIWTHYFKLFDAENAESLQDQINSELKNDECGYYKIKKVIDINKL